MTGLYVRGGGFEMLAAGERIGARRLLEPPDVSMLQSLSARYARAVHTHAEDTAFIGLGRELWAWLDGAAGQFATMVERAPSPLVFEVTGPRRPSEVEWALLRAPFELLAPPEEGFLAADGLLRFAVVRRLGDPAPVPELDEYRLGLAFMASAPRGQRELDFEGEEAAILAAVQETRLDLLVEDTGDPASWASA